MKENLLSFLLTAISRTLLLRDRLNGTMLRLTAALPPEASRISISSGGRTLAALYTPAERDSPALLICHGIGERVEYWGQVQTMLRHMGIASLVFNYSGYGESSGYISVVHCEEDARSAYRELTRTGDRPVFLLGYSLGTGVASAVASSLELSGLILCEGFTTLREGATAVGFPGWMTHLIPDHWQTIHRVSELRMPILVVHSDQDELFPLPMAHRVAEACGSNGKIIVVPGMEHNEPIFIPGEIYWQPIVDWINGATLRR